MTEKEQQQVAIERINWAHQRELAIVAAMLGLGLAAVELILNNSDSMVLTTLYLFDVLGFGICFYSIFIFQREIFKWQKRLKAIKDVDWEIDFNESIFHYFFDFEPKVEIEKLKAVGVTVIVASIFVLFFTLRRIVVSNVPSNLNEPSLSIIGFVSGIVSAMVIFVATDYLRRRNDIKIEKNKTIYALKLELEQNLKFSDESGYIMLSNDEWSQAIKNGQSLQLNEQLQKKLMVLYAKISNKNNLTGVYLSNLESATTLTITDSVGQNPVLLLDVLKNLTNDIKQDIQDTLRSF